MYKVECTVRQSLSFNHTVDVCETYKFHNGFDAWAQFVKWGDDCLENGYEAELVMWENGEIRYMYIFSEGEREVVTSPLD